MKLPQKKHEPVPDYWSVVFSNYYPREVDSTWATREEAEQRAAKLNQPASGLWCVEAGYHGTTSE